MQRGAEGGRAADVMAEREKATQAKLGRLTVLFLEMLRMFVNSCVVICR